MDREKSRVRTGNMNAGFISNRDKISGFGVLFEVTIEPSIEKSLKDHVILGHNLFPGTGFLELILEATQTLDEAYSIETCTIEQPLELKGVKYLQLLLREDKANYALTLIDAEENTYSEGLLTKTSHGFELVTLPKLKEQIDVAAFYAQLKQAGLSYGPEFARIQSIYKNKDSAIAQINPVPQHKFLVHPAELDCALQLLSALVSNDNSVYLPFQYNKVLFNPEAGVVDKAYIQLLKQDEHSVQAKVQLLDKVNRIRLEIGEFSARKTDKQHLNTLLAAKKESLFAEGDWRLITAEINNEQPKPVLFSMTCLI